jgi:hypothetical protein
MSDLFTFNLTISECAANFGRIEILTILALNGADINVTNDDGEYVTTAQTWT